MGISPDTERLARAMFRPEQIPDVLEDLGWYDSELPDNVHRAVLALSKGNIDALLGYVAAAVTDFRDVLLWASEPEPTPEERAAAQARVRSLVREAAQRRRRLAFPARNHPENRAAKVCPGRQCVMAVMPVTSRHPAAIPPGTAT
jgi:hypothetical protein